MAIQITKSQWLLATPDDLSGRPVPFDHTGKIRVLHSTWLQVGIGDIGSQFYMMEAPFGRIRFLPYLARFKNSAFGASATLSLGLGAYYNASIPDPISQTAEDDTCLGAATTVAAAGGPTAFTSAPLKWDVYSRGPGPMVIATLAGAAVPDGATLEIILPYVAE
jgi:hypothetical protein